MFCRYCGEENPENAVFCKNCGKRLKEEVKKPEVIETLENNNYNQKTTQSTTTTSSSSGDNSDWIGCCLCLIAIFIIFAIMGSP